MELAITFTIISPVDGGPGAPYSGRTHAARENFLRAIRRPYRKAGQE
jgi:hypothetical protein